MNDELFYAKLRAYSVAKELGHDFISVDHFMYGLLDNYTVIKVLHKCGVDSICKFKKDILRKLKRIPKTKSSSILIPVESEALLKLNKMVERVRNDFKGINNVEVLCNVVAFMCEEPLSYSAKRLKDYGITPYSMAEAYYLQYVKDEEMISKIFDDDDDEEIYDADFVYGDLSCEETFGERGVKSDLLCDTKKRLTEKTDDIEELPAVKDEVKKDDIEKGHLVFGLVSVLKKKIELDKEKLRSLEGALKNNLFGQDTALEEVADAVLCSKTGFHEKDKPVSLLLTGPSGVGKTETARTLAIHLYGSEDALVRMDMSEFQEKYSVSRLIGSAPGYVGYDDSRGQLPAAIRKHPNGCVVLFDEIEKAHSDIFNVLLQVLEGHITDNHGEKVYINNKYIIIMTSN